MIDILLSLVLITWPLGQLLALVSFSSTTHWTLLDLLNLLLLIFVFWKDKKKILSDPLTKYFALFSFACLVSLLANFQLGIPVLLSSSLYLVRWLCSLSIYYATKYHLNKKHLKLFQLSLIAFVALGLAQYIFFPDMRFLKTLGFDDHYFRLIGTFFDPNFTGMVLAGISLYLISQNKKLFSLATLIALALTFSRASYLSFVVGLLTLIILQKRFKLLLFLIALTTFVVLIPKPFGEGVNLFRTYSITSRLQTQNTAINTWLSHPIFGVGFNTLKFTTNTKTNLPLRASGVDNSFLYVLATAGIIGFISYLLLLFQIGKKLLPKPELLAIFSSLLFHSLFNNTIFYLWITVLLWLILGITTKVGKTK